ncbi:hypothetical protein chiPu_0029044 [Chiloscyllium punctatum]|uniref:Uncharacterized protein n=1 Tax=Chiloscyllium punctatum TaxID=137246 RepID=A0A401TQ84_CHIPU|nr:hypothetical protein [Chiloscyllium punctatum]
MPCVERSMLGYRPQPWVKPGRCDGAAVAGMRLDDLALPFRIEQIGRALRRLLGLHQTGVVGNDRQPDPEARELSIGIAMLVRRSWYTVFPPIFRCVKTASVIDRAVRLQPDF